MLLVMLAGELSHSRLLGLLASRRDRVSRPRPRGMHQSLNHHSRSRKVKCNQLPGQDKVISLHFLGNDAKIVPNACSSPPSQCQVHTPFTSWD